MSRGQKEKTRGLTHCVRIRENQSIFRAEILRKIFKENLIHGRCSRPVPGYFDFITSDFHPIKNYFYVTTHTIYINNLKNRPPFYDLILTRKQFQKFIKSFLKSAKMSVIRPVGSPIHDFYKEKNIFITGVTGFIGKVSTLNLITINFNLIVSI